jgi:hypothetical protein
MLKIAIFEHKISINYFIYRFYDASTLTYISEMFFFYQIWS